MSRTIKALLPFLLSPLAVLANESPLLKCRGIEQPLVRLSCYDALVPTESSEPASIEPEAKFGLTESAQAQSIESHIPGVFEGWQPKTRLALANGQRWEVTDGSTGVYRRTNPKVRIRRGAFGAFYLEVDNVNHSPRVKRVD